MNSEPLDGQLQVSTTAFCKKLWIENHRITFAQSNLPDDTFGCFLLRRKIIGSAMLEKSRTYMQKHKTRHGRALLELGALTPEQLWTEISAHLQEIIFSLFALKAGIYEIKPLPENESENIVLSLAIPETILVGIRQIEDRAFIEGHFRQDMTLYLTAAKNLMPLALKPYESHVLFLVEQQASLAAIVKKSELLRFDTLKILYSLLKLDLISCQKEERFQPSKNFSQHAPTVFTSFEEILQYYNNKLAYICRMLTKEIGPVAMSILFDAVSAILDSIPAYFRNLEFSSDGRIEEKSVLKSIWYENFADNHKEFLKGLEEILYAEIYAVKRHLGKDHEKLILQWIRESGA
jgi:hypothetical protein